MRTRLSIVAIALALLTACASSDLREPTVVASAGSGAPSAAGNKATAQAEAHALTAKVSLPPGAVRVRTQPAGLNGPAVGTPSSSHLIDTIRYYTVAMSLARAHAWFQRPQPGFSLSATSTGRTTFGYWFDVSTPHHWAWGQATLNVGLASEGAAVTGIRVDGVAQWIDPTPVRDTSGGPVLRVTLQTGCPKSDRGRRDIGNPDAADLDRQLLPTTEPTAALRCTYDGMNGKAFALTAGRRLTAAQATAAAARIRALPLGSLGLGGHSCPSDDGRATVLAFAYPGRPDVDIWQSTSGCQYTDNGHIVSGDF